MQIVQYDYSGSASQLWTFVDAGSGYYYIQNVGDGKVMDVNSKSTADSASIDIYQNNGGTNQQFQRISTNGAYMIENKNSGKAFDISGAVTTNGGILIQYAASGSNNQLFTLTAVSSGNTSSGAASSGNTSSGAASSGTSSSGSSSSSTSGFQQLNQSQIIAAMGAGWNLGNSLESNNNGTSDETAWGYPAVTQSLIDSVKKAGFKSIRIPVSYLSQIGSAPNYTIDSACWHE